MKSVILGDCYMSVNSVYGLVRCECHGECVRPVKRKTPWLLCHCVFEIGAAQSKRSLIPCLVGYTTLSIGWYTCQRALWPQNNKINNFLHGWGEHQECYITKWFGPWWIQLWLLAQKASHRFKLLSYKHIYLFIYLSLLNGEYMCHSHNLSLSTYLNYNYTSALSLASFTCFWA